MTITITTPLAQARTTHSFESVITEVPPTGPGGPVPAPGGLSEVNSMTVNSGDLYVAERLDGGGVNGEFSRADQWQPSASKPGEYEFVSQLPGQPRENLFAADAIAFGGDAANPELYIGQPAFEDATSVNVFSAGTCGTLECASLQTLWKGKGGTPSPPSPFASVDGAVVDHSTATGDWASGDVFVDASSVIDIFKTELNGTEHFVKQAEEAAGAIVPAGPVAVSGFNGDLIAGDRVFGPEEEAAKEGKYAPVCQLEASGAPLEGISAVAVDDGNGEIYVAASVPASGPIFEFDHECKFLGTISRVPKEGTPGGVPGQSEEVPFGGAIRSLAVDPASHRLFVGNQNGPGVVDVFGPDAVVPDVVTGPPGPVALETDPATGADSWRVQATGEVNPDSAGKASCAFTWGLTEAFGNEAPCSGPVEEGSIPVAVNASLTHLEPDTSYVYHLQATNANGTNHGDASQDVRFTTPGPGLRSESASNVSASSATLEATIAPHEAPTEANDLQAATGTPTSYFFQYTSDTRGTGVCATEPKSCSSAPLSPASLGSGLAEAEVSQHLVGLEPNTTYHYRLVAQNEALPATEPGVLIPFYAPDHTFTTQGPGGPVVLLDNRAEELVSPADKRGAVVEPSGLASVDGARFTFRTSQPTEPEPAGNGVHGIQVLSSRVAPGQWSSVDINLSRSSPEGGIVNIAHEYVFFSPDLGLSMVESEGPFSIPEGSHQNERGEWERIVEASPVPTERTPYLRRNTTCAAEPRSCYEPLLDSEDVTSGEKIEGPETTGEANFVGATPDARHALISSHVSLTPPPGAFRGTQGALYEWSAERPPAGRLSLVSLLPENEGGEATEGVPEGLSPDGARVLFFSGGLYLRDTTRGERGETARLDLTEAGSAPSGGIDIVGGTSTDLSKVFFTDRAMLTSRSGAEGTDLYVCELGPEGPAAPKCALTDLTPARPTGKGSLTEPAEVSHVLNVSRDGSYVYFLAKGVQAAGASPSEGERENLYLAHQHEGKWTTSLIASARVSLQAEGTESVVSPDGRWFAFSSRSQLTGYDNRDAKTGAPDTEVYLYDVGSGSHPPTLVCASCDPSGARPVGPTVVPASPHGNEGSLGKAVWQQEPGARSLFDSGRLFLDSADALVPQDTNGNTDVYEYEPAGAGSCTPADPTFNPTTGGCTGLISSGRASGESVFLEASANGSDVFFTTAERLVATDKDTALDVYDAHECSAASPCPASSILPPPCTTEASCIAPPSPQPSIFGPPSSATFSGPGNILPEPKPKTGAQIRAEKLSKALASCRHRYKRQRKRRAACEKQAHKAYGAAKKAKRASRDGRTK